MYSFLVIRHELDSNESTTLSVTNTRIQILLSSDGGIGIGFVHHTKVSKNNDTQQVFIKVKV